MRRHLGGLRYNHRAVWLRGQPDWEKNLRWADYQHHHTKVTYFRTLLGKLLYYQKIGFAADERQRDGRPGWSSGKKLLTQIKKQKQMETSLSYKSPQHTKTEGVLRSKLVPQAEHATCMSP